MTQIAALARPPSRIAIRAAEAVTLLPLGESGRNEVVGRIEQVAYMGDHLEYTISAAGRTVVLPAAKKEQHTIGADVRLAFDPTRITILPR